jgi:hypothetical protein
VTGSEVKDLGLSALGTVLGHKKRRSRFDPSTANTGHSRTWLVKESVRLLPALSRFVFCVSGDKTFSGRDKTFSGRDKTFSGRDKTLSGRKEKVSDRDESIGRKKSAEEVSNILCKWLCHSDARQVSDLPARGLLSSAVLDRRLSKIEGLRQVRDLPRIGVAEPFRGNNRGPKGRHCHPN